MRRVLARRDMRLYVAGQALSLFGDTALWLALAATDDLDALGAILIAFVDYRLLLVIEAAVVAAAGAWLLTRPEQRVAAPH